MKVDENLVIVIPLLVCIVTIANMLHKYYKVLKENEKLKMELEHYKKKLYSQLGA